MKIGIDARLYGPRVGGGGLGRYVEELIKSLEQIDRTNEYVIFLRKENWDDYTPAAPNFKKMLAPWRWYTLAEQFGMPWVIRKAKLDLLHVPHFNIPVFSRVPLVATIHDLILLSHTSDIRASRLSPYRYWIKYFGFLFIIRMVVRRARTIIAVSEATRTALLEKFHSAPERIVTVYSGTPPLPPEQSPENQKKTLEKYHIHAPYLLAVGNAYPHKNLDGLIRAFYDIIKSDPNILLVSVGSADSFRAQLEELARTLGVSNRIIFTGFVDEHTLDSLYRNAQAYAVTSFLEGFAFPGLEAQRRGIPVIASDIPAHREVFGESAVYANPNDPLHISSTIKNTLADAELLAKLRESGLQNIQRFSWHSTAEQTIAVYLTERLRD